MPSKLRCKRILECLCCGGIESINTSHSLKAGLKLYSSVRLLFFLICGTYMRFGFYSMINLIKNPFDCPFTILQRKMMKPNFLHFIKSMHLAELMHHVELQWISPFDINISLCCFKFSVLMATITFRFCFNTKFRSELQNCFMWYI